MTEADLLRVLPSLITGVCTAAAGIGGTPIATARVERSPRPCAEGPLWHGLRESRLSARHARTR